MKIEYKHEYTIRNGTPYYDGTKHKVLSFCCETMEEQLDETVTFGEVESYGCKDEAVFISTCRPYPEGACWDSVKISFCPFCGEAIICEEVLDLDRESEG